MWRFVNGRVGSRRRWQIKPIKWVSMRLFMQIIYVLSVLIRKTWTQIYNMLSELGNKLPVSMHGKWNLVQKSFLDPDNSQIPGTLTILKHRLNPTLLYRVMLTQELPAINDNSSLNDLRAESHQSPHNTKIFPCR